MSDLLPTTMSTSNVKISPWKRPGGTLGLVCLGFLTAGGVVLFAKILPWLITLTTNVITLTALCVALGAILWVLTDKTFRNMASNIYFMVMRKLTGLVIQLDPIAILQKKIRDMHEKIGEMRKSIEKVNGQYFANKRKIAEKKALVEKHLQRAKIYKENGKQAEYTLEATSASFAKKLADNYTKRNADIEKWLEILKKLLEYAEFTVRKTEAEVEFRSEEYKSIQEQHKAFSSFKSIVKGDNSELEDFTRAMDYMAMDVDNKLSEMDYWLNSTGGIMSEIDIEKGIMSKDAEELLKKYEEGGFDNLFKSFDKPEAIEGVKSTLFDINNIPNNDNLIVMDRKQPTEEKQKSLQSYF